MRAIYKGGTLTLCSISFLQGRAEVAAGRFVPPNVMLSLMLRGRSRTTLGRQRCTPTNKTSTWLKCLLPRAERNQTFAPTAPLLWNATLGFAAISPDVLLDSRFEIHSVSPQFVSRGGSAELTIKGFGFTVAATGCDRFSHDRLLPHLVSKVHL